MWSSEKKKRLLDLPFALDFLSNALVNTHRSLMGVIAQSNAVTGPLVLYRS